MPVITILALAVGIIAGFFILPKKFSGMVVIVTFVGLWSMFFIVPLLLDGLGLGGVPIWGQLLSNIIRLLFGGLILSAIIKLFTD